MREYSWLERPVSWTGLRAFEDLLARAALARAWLAELGLDDEGETPDSSAAFGAAALARLTAKFGKGGLEPVFRDWCASEIGARTPEEALLELARAVREAETAAALRVKDAPRMHEISFEQGRIAGRRAGNSGTLHAGGSLPPLRSILMALHHSPLGWLDRPSQLPPLVERDVPGRIDWVLLECPHRDALVAEPAVQDFLCEQALAWFRGFCASIDPRLALERAPRDPARGCCRAVISWSGGAGR